MDVFDYIVVGAGSAGCVLAERLTASGRARVLVLEAGGHERAALVRVPLGYGRLFHDPVRNWRFHAEPEPALDGRALYMPRGRGVGGSGAINAMVYARGLPGDFDDWEAAGNPGWGSTEARAAFARLEAGLTVSDVSADHHPVCRRFAEAVDEAGLPRGDPSLGEGAGPWRLTTRAGRRHSAADAFLAPAARRANLDLVTGARVTGLVLEGGRVGGVRYRRRGAECLALCRGEVLLAAGAVQTPQILQLSGIGPGALLQRLGLPVHVDNPAVGGHLQDHLAVDYAFRASEPTLNQVLGRRSGQAAAALRYALARRGPLALSVNQAGALLRSAPERARPDTQLYFNPLTYSVRHAGRRPLLRPDPWPGFCLGFNPCRPTSRGRIDIAAPDAEAPPRITLGAPTTSGDVADVVAGARLVARLLATPALRRLAAAPLGFTPEGATDEAIVADFRARAGSVYHPCGTARMAPRDAGGVVDSACRVYGVQGLRVIDASIFPNITSANTNAPTMMAALRAADLVLAGRELP